MPRLIARLLLFSLVTQAVLDLSAFFVPTLGAAAQIWWLGLGVVLVVAASVILVRDIVLGVPSVQYRVLLAASVGALIALFTVYATLPSSISHEATQEVACGLEFLAKPGLGYARNCFLGYPVRQYLLPAVPSVIFGRSQLALNVGGGLYLVLGLIVFSSAVLVTFKRTPFAHVTALVLITLPLHLYYFNQFLLMFEQSIYPFALGLLAVGFLLRARALSSATDFYLCGIAITFLAYSYTPGLALPPLAVLALALTLHQAEAVPAPRIGRTLLLLCTAVALYVSLSTRADLHLTEPGRSMATYLSDVLRGGSIIFAHTDLPFSTWAFTIVLGGVLLAALLWRLRWWGFLSAIWVLSVFTIAIAARGYWYYEVEFRVHRTLVAIPVVLLLLVAILKRYEPFLRRRASAALLLAAALVINGFGFHYSYLSKKQQYRPMVHLDTLEMSRQLALIKYLEHQGGFRGSEEGVFLLTPGVVPSFLSINDELRYFMPRMTMIRLSECDSAPRPRGERPVLGIVASSSHECAEMIETLRARSHGQFMFQGTTAFVYATDLSSVPAKKIVDPMR